MSPVTVEVIPGYGAASGKGGNPKFPGGTLEMQRKLFKDAGFLDFDQFYKGTINVRLPAPLRYRVVKPLRTIHNVKWHPSDPAEDFSVFDVLVSVQQSSQPPVQGLIYFPHPDTKPDNIHPADVLEIILPHFVEGISPGAKLTLQIPPDQMVIE